MILYVTAALIIAVLWVVSGVVSSAASKMKFPTLPSLPLPQEPEETPAETYSRILALAHQLPMTEGERTFVVEQARKKYIAEAGGSMRIPD